MQIGVYTRYFRHEATYVALRIAQWVTAHGGDVSLYSDEKNHCSVDPDWDAQVRHPPLKFTEWAKSCTTIVWTHTPLPEQLSWCARNKKRAVLVPLWHELRSDDRRAYRGASFVVTPARAVACLLKARWGLSTCLTAPWDPGLPWTVKSGLKNKEKLRLLLPWYDHAPNVSSEPLLKLLVSLSQREDMSLTITYSPSRVMPSAARRLQGLTKPGHVTLLKSVPPWQRALVYGQHDLTLWPAEAENTGLVGLSSLAMGTPVIAFAGAIASEFLSSKNGVLVPCESRGNSLGVPRVLDDYARFEEYLRGLLAHRDHIARLQDGTMFNADSRRAIFDDCWQRVLLS